MRRWTVFIALSLPLLSGCGLLVNAARNAYNEPTLALDECRFSHKTRRLAKAAWEEYRNDNPVDALSNDYKDGFLDGYADYLDAGGSGDPPPTPPKRYQRTRYQTPAGLRAIEEYFQGFQQGTRTAIDSGQRHGLVLPVLVPAPCCDPAQAPSIIVAPLGEQLPAPKISHPSVP